MNQNTKIFIKQTYELFKRDFWILIAVNISASLIIHFTFDFHPAIVVLTVAILFFKSMTFVRGSSIMPSVSSDFDRFSWKYYMGMPLNKKELILSLVITNLIVMIPLFTWAACFFPQLLELIAVDPFKLKWMTVLKSCSLVLAFFCFTSLKSVHQQVINPRHKYSKVSSKILFFQRLTKSLLVLSIGIYTIVGMEYIEAHSAIKFDFLFDWIEPTFSFIFKTWFIMPTAFAAVIGFYYVLIHDWQNEKRGYIRQTWNTKRDGSIITACLSSLILPFFIFDLEIPSLYGNSELNRAVYYKDYKKVIKLIESGADINKTSDSAYSPVFVAINERNVEMLKILVEKGASLDGKIIRKNSTYNGMNALHLAVKTQNYKLMNYILLKNPALIEQTNLTGDYPIHTAARACRIDILDTLIKSTKNVNIQNKDGETPLHLAVRSGCFASVSLLLEHGSDIKAKNKTQQLAADFIRESSRIDNDEAYFLERKLRSPASQN